MAGRPKVAKYCCLRCQQRAAERRRPKREQGTRRAGVEPRIVTCEACAQPFDANVTRSTRSTRFCTSRCYEWNRTHGRPRDRGRKCVGCEIPIDHLPQGAKACCRRCQSWALANPGKLRRRAAELCGACGASLAGRDIRTRHCDYNCRWWAQQHPGVRKTGERTCRSCGTDISSRGSRALFCSDQCFYKDPRQLENARARAKRRRALLADCPTVDFTQDQLLQRLSMYGFSCYVCSEPAAHVDHVKPVNATGAHMLSNFRPICASCNSIKKDRWPVSSKVIRRGGTPEERVRHLRRG